MPRLLMSEFSVSEKRKKWKHCDLNFLDKHKTQFIDLLNIFGKIHFTLIVTHTKLILSKNIRFFAVNCFACIVTAFCRISIYKLISDIELSFLSFSFFVLALNMEKKISFGCFTNLGYDEVGKLNQAKIQAKFFTNDIALLRSIFTLVENWLQ